MEKQLFLSAFINVFDVVPAFLLPVFTNGIQFFFQVISKDTISSFEEADMTKFVNCKYYRVDKPIHGVVNSPAIYGIDMSTKLLFGSSIRMLQLFNEHAYYFNKFPEFTKQFEEFKSSVDTSKSSLFLPVPVSNVVYLDVSTKQIEVGLLERKLGDIFQHSFHFFTEDSSSLIKRMFLNNDFELISSDKDGIIVPKDSIKTVNSIFEFYRIKHARAKQNDRSFYYRKKARDCLSVVQQVEALERILLETPITISRLLSMHHVWHDDDIYNLFNSMLKRKVVRYNTSLSKRVYNMQLRSWGICDDLKTTKSDPNEFFDNSVLDEMQYSQYMKTELIIRKLSEEFSLIYLRNCQSMEFYIKLINYPARSIDLITFLEELYLDVHQSILLFPIYIDESLDILNDELSSWLSRNERRYVIISSSKPLP